MEKTIFLNSIMDYLRQASLIFKKKCPDLDSISEEKLFKLYHEMNQEIEKKLIYHRHSPIPAEIFFKLDEIKTLPKRVRVLLDSMDWSVPKIIYK